MLQEDEAPEQPDADLATPFLGGATPRNVEMMTARRLWADSFLENINADRPDGAMWQVVPANSDRSKRPFGEWKKYQDPRVRMQEKEFERVLTRKGDAIGVVTGNASNALLIELEGRAVADGAFDLLNDVANASGVAELWQRVVNGLAIETPSGGVHLWVSCIDEGFEYPPNQPLARNEAGEILAETRGEGGFAIVAPSYGRKGHPEGSRYEFRTRDDETRCQPEDVATVTGAEIEMLLDFVRNVLSTQAELELDPSPAHKGDTDRQRPGDDFNARADFAELLAEEGWSLVHSAGERDFYRRPNKGEGVSGNLKSNVFYNHSTSVGNLPAGKGFTPFTFYTHTKHHGNYKDAAKALALKGYGDPLDPENKKDKEPQPFVPEAQEPEHRPRGAELLDDIERLLRRYVCLQNDRDYHLTTLWIATTYGMSAFSFASRLIFWSPEKACGKTRMLELLQYLCYRTQMVGMMTAAYFVRRVSDSDEHRMTLILDEADTVLKGSHDDDRKLINALNTGYTKNKGGMYGVVEEVKGEWKTREYSSFAPVAIASIGLEKLPDPILSRSLQIMIGRRLPNQIVEPFEITDGQEILAPFGKSLYEWTRPLLPRLQARNFIKEVKLPASVTDRDADIFRPIFVMANEAGGHWPERAREAALSTIELRKLNETAGSKLLGLLMAWIEEQEDKSFILTNTIVERLRQGQDDDSSEPLDDGVRGMVSERSGKISSGRLARALKRYNLTPTHQTTGSRRRGYRYEDIKAAHDRYGQSREIAVTSVTPTNA